jgi:hypothetical protein
MGLKTPNPSRFSMTDISMTDKGRRLSNRVQQFHFTKMGEGARVNHTQPVVKAIPITIGTANVLITVIAKISG